MHTGVLVKMESWPSAGSFESDGGDDDEDGEEVTAHGQQHLEQPPQQQRPKVNESGPRSGGV